MRVSAANLRQVGKGSEVALLTANTRNYLYLFAKDGRCRRVSVHEIPQSGDEKHLAELTDFSRRDSITAALTLPRSGNTDGYLFMVTEQGMVKRVTLGDFMAASASAELRVMNVDEKDKLSWVLVTTGGQEVLLVSNEGQSIRFAEEDVRSMGLAAGGVGGMKLKKGINIIYAAPVDPEGELLTMTAQGYAKRSSLSEYSSQGRNGGGVVTHKTTSRTGNVSAALMITSNPPEAIIVLPRKGGAKSVSLDEIPVMGRGVQGKQIVEIGDGNAVVALHFVTSSYQVAAENRVVVEEEIEAVTTGPVKKANPFNGKPSAAPTTNGSNGKATQPIEKIRAEKDKAPAKPAKTTSSRAAATPKPAATTSVVREKASPTAEKTKAPVKASKVEAAPKATTTNGSSREKAAPEKAKAEKAASASATPGKVPSKVPSKVDVVSKPSMTANGHNGKTKPAATANRDGDKKGVKAAKAEAASRPTQKARTASAQPANDIPSKAKAEVKKPAAKQEGAQRATPKAKSGEAQPQQPSLLPVEKTPAATPAAAPRRDQKLAAVTSVKRPKK
jgi:DNA gyrase subunit A